MIRKIFILCIILCITLLIWAIKIEPYLLEVKKYTFKDEELNGLRIVYATDFHLAPNDEGRFKKIASEIIKQNPDIILLGGDYIKGHTFDSAIPLAKLSQSFAKLHAPCGIYSILGNHDWYVDGTKIIEALKAANITVLENENQIITCKKHIITIAGTADNTTRKVDLTSALAYSKQPIILLTHSPDVFVDVKTKINLILAGHTHGGQVKIPFLGAVLTSSAYGRRFAEGLFKENDNTMIVSKGLGNSLLPLRFNCLPEIVVIDFE